MKRHILLALAALSLTAPAFHAHAAEGQSELETLFIRAENEPNKDISIGLWNDILSKLGNDSHPSITKKLVQYNIVNDVMRIYAKQQDVDQLQQAQRYIRTIDGEANRGWAYIHVLHEMAKHPRIKQDGATYDIARSLIDDVVENGRLIQDATTKSHLFYGLADVVSRAQNNSLIFAAEELGLLHGFIDHITDSRLRIAAMKMAAKSASAAPSDMKPLYSLLGTEKLPSSKLVALHEKAIKNDTFDLALYALLAIDDIKQRPKKLREFFRYAMDNKQYSRAFRIAEKTDNISAAVDLWSALGIHYMEHDYEKQADDAHARALSFAEKIRKKDSLAKAMKVINERREKALRNKGKKNTLSDTSLLEVRKTALKLTQDGDIATAVQYVKAEEDYLFRVKTFREIAEIQTRMNDSFKLLPSKEDGNTGTAEFYTHGGVTSFDVADQDDVDTFSKAIDKKLSANPDNAIIKNAPSSPIGNRIARSPLVERIAMDGEQVRRMIPPITGADISVAYYENNIYNAKFYGVYGNAGFTQSQKSTTPLSIIIENGTTDIGSVYDAMQTQGHTQCIKRSKGIYTLRCPLVVNPSASFVLTGDDVEALRLSTQYGAYIVNVGKFYMSDTTLTGWDEKENSPMFATYKDKRKFRPYITAWSRSKLFIANSMIQTLGYGNGKSYGFSMSAGPNDWYKLGNRGNKERPTGIVVDNSFHNTLYGYYSYEADDVVLVGNEYIDNIVYGIDPHDRSERLAIAYNTAYGTYKKHGIIISREVNDSLIMGNVSFENKGTGIMLDRDSNHTLVYGNTSFYNKNAGMTIFESDCEIIAANKIFENKGTGFRIRNSYNIGLFHNDVTRNRAGVIAYTGVLKGDAVHSHRDFDLDPYDTLTTITAVGNHIEANKSGITLNNVDAAFFKQNRFVNQSPKVFNGEWFSRHADEFFRTDRKNDGAVMHASCPDLDEPLKVQSCPFRENGTLFADGQDQFIARMKKSQCAKEVIDELQYTSGGHH